MTTRSLAGCLVLSLMMVACGLSTGESPAPAESAPASLSSSPSPTALPIPSPTALPTASRSPFPWAYRDLSKIVLVEGDLEPGETIDSLDVGLDALLQPVALLENSTFGDQPGFVDARMTRIGIEGQDSYWEVGGYVSWAAVYANSGDGDLAFHVLVSEHESEVGWGMERVGRDAYGFEGVSLDGAAYGWDTNRLYIWREGSLILAAGALGSTATSDDALERLEEIARIMDARAADWNWVGPSGSSWRTTL